jgi:signal transduction histidine kinase
VSTTNDEAATVLVVDDDPSNRALLRAILESAGYRVVEAESGAGALGELERQPPDLVLLDVLMPGMDGFATCAALRARPGGSDVPIVLVTALGDLTTHARAIETDADDFLTKPVQRTELLVRVRSLIRVRRLSRQIRENAEIIRAQRDELVRSQQQKDELAAFIVHDLKNPLGGILANVQFVQSQLADPELRGALDDAVTASRAMLRMVLNLLDISRAEDGALKLNRAEFDARRLIDELRRQCERHVTTHGRTFVVREVGERTRVLGDIDIVRRVLENLLDNATKHTPSGGEVKLELRLDRPGWLLVRVCDGGRGIPAEYRDRVFDKYVQLDRELREYTASRGLGLAFCRMAVEAHGGRIWVEDNQPRGSAFCFELPLAG